MTTKDQPVDEQLREKLLKICHKYELKEFMDIHGKCDMDLAAPRCAKRVKELEKLIQAECNRARIEELELLRCHPSWMTHHGESNAWNDNERVEFVTVEEIDERIKELQQLMKEGE